MASVLIGDVTTTLPGPDRATHPAAAASPRSPIGTGQLAPGVLLAWLLIAVELLIFLYFGSAWLARRGELVLEQQFREFWLAFGAHGRGPTVLFLWLHPLIAVHLWLSARAQVLQGRRRERWLTLAPVVLLAILSWCLYRYGALPAAPTAEIALAR